jgi:pimeloyl-ACP methyl ester carboxylesterase
LANLNKTIDRAAAISRDVTTRLERRMRKAVAAYGQSTDQARSRYLEQLRPARMPWDLWREGAEYAVDFAQRSAIFWDIMRQRGNNYIEHEGAGKPPLLAYQYEMLSDGRKFERPVNYALVRIVTPAGISTDESLRPFIIVDPRAGHGPGIGGFKADSEVGVALLAGHAVYFVIFFPEPEQGQTLADVVDAEAEFVRLVAERHPKSAKPVLVGNCQAGWAVMLLAASRPELVGAIVLNGAPMSYWSGNDGENPMRYAGGLMGGAWSSLLASDLGAGKFDGAHLVQNFENLNPSNALWGKYYHLWENIDTEPERFLDFERWWGGYYLLNDEEIRWIVNNLFVGNKLAAGEAKLGPGRYFDLKSIKSPIIIFASMGDNITPPQQAFNWIADVYRNSDEIKANGQTIVGLVHEDIGHLGIFVSGAVAKKEHAQIIEVLKYIQQLPPGLYGMDIHEAVGLDGSIAYEVSLAERKVEEVRQLQKRDRMDEKPFEAVAAVSELTERAYELLVRPMVREMVPEWAAKAARELHPLRAQRWMFSDKNPMLAGLPYLAFSARSGRKSASEANPMRQREKLASDLIMASLDLYRDLRDAAREAAFYQIYGSLVSLQAADQRAETRRDSKFDPREVSAVRQVLETLEDGDLQEGLTRMALLLAKEGGGTRELSQMARAREILAPARGIKPMSEDEVRRLLHEETIVTEFEPERALHSLPRLIRTREERKIARAYLDRVEKGMPLNDRQRALLQDFRERLPSPARARATRKVRKPTRRTARR